MSQIIERIERFICCLSTGMEVVEEENDNPALQTRFCCLPIRIVAVCLAYAELAFLIVACILLFAISPPLDHNFNSSAYRAILVVGIICVLAIFSGTVLVPVGVSTNDAFWLLPLIVINSILLVIVCGSFVWMLAYEWHQLSVLLFIAYVFAAFILLCITTVLVSCYRHIRSAPSIEAASFARHSVLSYTNSAPSTYLKREMSQMASVRHKRNPSARV